MGDNEYTVKGLTPGKEYEFRVAAANKAGVGKFSVTDSPIEARPPDCPPKAFGFVNGQKEMVVKAGDTLRIVVPFQGSPKPNTNWSKVGQDILKEDDRLKFEISQTEAVLIAPNATLKDTGVYNCTLRNDFGSERVAIKVTVLDKPGSPQGPLEVSNLKADSCTLNWKSPKEDGGSPVTNYIVEKYDTKKKEWQKVSSFCKIPVYDVIGLEEGRPYKFRVSAENVQGVSEPLETEITVVPKNPFSKKSINESMQLNAKLFNVFLF